MNAALNIRTNQTPVAVSVSRRTDVPAYYGTWFQQRLMAGRVRYTNPFGSVEYELQLDRDSVLGYLFWSKNYAPFLGVLEDMDRARLPFYCHFTITGLPSAFEPRVPPPEETVRTLTLMAERFGAHRICWRFDPIIITSLITAELTVKRFGRLAELLAERTHRCYVSFVDFYRKVATALTAQSVIDVELQVKQEMIRSLSTIARDHGMTVYVCCETELVATDAQQAHCLDADIIAQLNPIQQIALPLHPTRTGCGCYASRDIGAYNSCPAGCVYCYANRNAELARTRFSLHIPTGENLLQIK